MSWFYKWIGSWRKPAPTTTTTTAPVTAPVPTLQPSEPHWENMAITTDNFEMKWNARISGGVIYLEPPRDGSISSALVLSKLDYLNPRLRITYSQKSADGWKCFWHIPYFKDLTYLTGKYNKNMNSLIPKSTGTLEMECAWDDVGENFAGPEPKIPPCGPNVTHIFDSQINGQLVTANLDGTQICTNFKPASWYSQTNPKFFEGSAKFGLYSEIAWTTVTKIERWIG